MPVIAFVLGLVVGSFLNVCILRIPEGTFFENLRSHCPACGAMIPWYLNVPVLSFFILRGRARCCGARLSWQYPVVEFGTGLMFALIMYRFPFIDSGDGATRAIFIDHAGGWRFLHAIVFCSILVVAAVIDLRLMIIPDVLSLGLVVLSPVVVALHPDLTWRSSLYGVILGAGILYAVAWTYWLIRHETGMGFGDVKLLAGIGGWLGYQAIFPVILIGSVSGSLVGISVMLWNRKFDGKTALPFGPFLAAGAVVHLMFSQEIRELWISIGL
jgi:leader peptidase (prepilin peptidase)/N-methyltransferase